MYLKFIFCVLLNIPRNLKIRGEKVQTFLEAGAGWGGCRPTPTIRYPVVTSEWDSSYFTDLCRQQEYFL